MQYADGRNAKLIKIHNRALVLKIIQQHNNISRKDIADLTGLTQATITKITRDLLEQGLIIEQQYEAPDSGAYGRRPIGLAINKERYHILAVHVGRYVLKSAVFDLAGNLLHKQECRKSVIDQDTDVIMQEIIGCLKDITHIHQIDLQQVLGIGISAPGPINAQEGILLGLDEIGGEETHPHQAAPFDWRDVPLKKAIQREFGVDAFADNDANVSALAESWFGNGIGVSNFVLYSIGAGVGAGVVIDGMLYRGEDDVVAEIGHTTINFNGPRCMCGNIGCLELYADFSHIVEEYRAVGSDTEISTIEQLFEAAYRHDDTARELILKRAKMLGIGAVSLANIFSPECIIVASNELGQSDLTIITEELQDCVCKRAFSVISDKVTVIQSSLKEDIQLYGAVALVLQDFFQLIPLP